MLWQWRMMNVNSIARRSDHGVPMLIRQDPPEFYRVPPESGCAIQLSTYHVEWESECRTNEVYEKHRDHHKQKQSQKMMVYDILFTKQKHQHRSNND